MNYFIPRALEAFANVDSVAAETADPADTVVIIGIADVAAINAALTLYPNPAATELNLSLANGNYNMSGVNVYDITGRLVLTSNTITNPQYHRISLSNLESGSYIVTISFETGEQVSKRLLVR
jgi:hypothetical protein